MAKKAKVQNGQLPADFVAIIQRMVGVHLAAGNWERATDAVHHAERMWRDRQEDLADPVTDPFVLSRHVSCLRLDARTVCQIDDLCNGTIGSLLEVFPSEFLSLSGIGLQTIKTIASELCRIGAFTPEQRSDAVMVFRSRRGCRE